MLTILDVHGLRAPLPSDLRRYHATKLAFMQARADVRYVLVQPGRGSWTEARARHVLVEHVEAVPWPASLDERSLDAARKLRDLAQLHRPNVIACGSAALLPIVLRIAGGRLRPQPALIGTWHAESGRERALPNHEFALGRWADAGERVSRWWSVQAYAGLDAVFVRTPEDGAALRSQGIERLYLTPMGIDLEVYSPRRRVLALIDQLRAGDESRPIVWTDAEASRVAPIYAELCRRTRRDPALVLANEDDDGRRRFAAAREQVHAPSFASEIERAELLASCDAGLCFGASTTAEAMACALPIVAPAKGRAAQLVRAASCGRASGEPTPAALASALLELVGDPERSATGRRGRMWISRFDSDSCFERELACYAEVLGHLRRGRRVPPGLHEPRQPPALSGS
jgi:alpha-1,6-mannosyltransferase